MALVKAVRQFCVICNREVVHERDREDSVHYVGRLCYCKDCCPECGGDAGIEIPEERLKVLE